MVQLSDITLIQHDFPQGQYYRVKYPKAQIVLHHTVSGKGSKGDVNWWITDPRRIATCIIIDSEGIANQLFWSGYWAHHLGVPAQFLKQHGFSDYASRNVILNRCSIGIELDSWGPLMDKGDQLYPIKWHRLWRKWVPNTSIKPVPLSDTRFYPNGYRGFYYYEKYTDKQIETARKLILLWHDKYHIPKDYDWRMWNVYDKALAGEKGIFTHSSYREDKMDCHPDPSLIDMLKSL